MGSYSFRLGELKPFRRRVINETEGTKQIKTKRRGAERVHMQSGIKRSRRAHTHTHTHRNALSRAGIVCNDRVPGGQCICVHDDRVCSRAAESRTNKIGYKRVGPRVRGLSSRVQDLGHVNREKSCRTAGMQLHEGLKCSTHTQKCTLTQTHTFSFESSRPLNTTNNFSVEKMLSLLFPTGSVGGEAPPPLDLIG